MSANQLRGAVILLVIATVLYGFRLASQHWSPEKVSMPQAKKKGDIITAEIKGSKKCNGIYSLSPGSAVSDLFSIAGINHLNRFDRTDLSINVRDGDKVIITTEEKKYSSIKVGRMEASTRYILDMPININNATVDDLELIPGIGKKTARAIVEYRKMNGMFKSLNDVPFSFGKKKSSYIAKYFYIDEES